MNENKSDVIIIGAGPCGLFAVFELGLLGLKSIVIDILDRPGGQCAELYPEKPIYDIPSRPKVTGRELTDSLMEQIKPFEPKMYFSQRADSLVKLSNGNWKIKTDLGIELEAPIICIAGGGGSFTPKKPRINDIDSFENKSLFYSVRKIEKFKGKNLIIAGGGDSALDWVLALNAQVNSMHLIHRRSEFRAMNDTVDKVKLLEKQGKLNIHVGEIDSLNGGNGNLESVTIKNKLEDKNYKVDCDSMLAFYGLTMKLGPIADWGINMDKNRILVDTEKFQTSEKGIFCIGDMCSYPGKLNLILSGFHEAALMAHGCFNIARPNEKLRFEYTTTSKNLQNKLVC
ncbi:MAG: ferredoxin--NADP(+) reductase [Alphaproteobacteria bacterium TMED87]|nr:ferredoxin--NADP(+) reductase [Rhodospirillaceae bacterium]OUV08629.1 MAG: ferredoxin--NADP(+) reductase [Alphaproteobacteria bacterium TMED87]